MITAIDTSETLLDCNSNLRQLCAQFQRKTMSTPDFVSAFTQVTERAAKLGLLYFSDYGTFAPVSTPSVQLDKLRSDAADFFMREELQGKADLLRSGTLNLPDTIWQLHWHFLLDRAAYLCIFWDSDRKKFVGP